MAGSYTINQTIMVGPNQVDVLINGLFVASGVVTVPEPIAMVLRLTTLTLGATRGRRS